MIYLKIQLVDYTLYYWDFVAMVLTDQYYMIFVLIPAYIIYILTVVKNENDLVLIRTGSYLKYSTTSYVSFLFAAGINISVHVVIALCAAVGLPYSNNFTNPFPTNHNRELIFDAIQFGINNPFLSIILVVVYLISGLAFLSLLIFSANIFFNNKFVLFFSAILYLSMILSIHTDFDNFIPFFFINKFILLHHGIEYNIYFLLVFEVVFITTLLIGIKKFWSLKHQFYISLKYKGSVVIWMITNMFSKKSFLLSFSLLSVLIISTFVDVQKITTSDFLILLFVGHGTGVLNLFEFIKLLLLNGLPLYILGCFLEKENINSSSIVSIRVKSRKKWLYSLLNTSLTLMFTYSLLTISLVLIVSWVFGIEMSGYLHFNEFFNDLGIPKVPLIELIIMILISKVLELFVSALILIIMFCLTRGATYGLILLLCLYISTLFKGEVVKYIPTGMSSLTRIYQIVGGNVLGFYEAITLLILYSIILFLVLRWGLSKKIIG
jgi:hypothetical protein